jgi:hypothetical protein
VSTAPSHLVKHPHERQHAVGDLSLLLAPGTHLVKHPHERQHAVGDLSLLLAPGTRQRRSARVVPEVRPKELDDGGVEGGDLHAGGKGAYKRMLASELRQAAQVVSSMAHIRGLDHEHVEVKEVARELE